MTRSITIAAPAKLNLFLRIIRRRPDGYHDLDSLMQKLELADRLQLTMTSRPGIRLRCPDVELPEDGGNLVYRAAAAFLRKTGAAAGLEIILEKNIPIAAGLGGGSSDAAAVLLGLDRLLGTGLALEELLALARPLGADVPFFVSPMPAARATGIGDHLQPAASLPEEMAVVLVNPGFPVSTRWVYENFALTTKTNTYMLGREETQDRQRWPAGPHPFELHNDLETVTLKQYPELERIKCDLMAGGACGALMSGSGPTVFGLFQDHSRAARCVAAFQPQYGKNVFLTGPLCMVH